MASSFIAQCLTSLLLFSLLPSFSFSFTSPPPSPIRAVNLGGWLVTEGWMTPWLFNNIKNKDLLDGTQVQFKSVAHNKYLTAENGGGAVVVATRPDASGWETFKEHWNGYIVEDDFMFMSENGINAVRIPVGYWIAKGDDPPLPFVGGSLQVLDRAFDWAEKYGLGVIVDLHAAPGSQNGNSHSGTRDGSQDWEGANQNIYDTVAVIDFLSSRYARRQGLLAMELINEPMAPRVTLEGLKKYYQSGYNAVRKYSTCYVIMSNRLGPHDPTELLQFASSLDGTVIDVHYYNLYNPIFQNKSLQENIDYVHINRAAQIGRITQSNGPLVFVGEWTAALDHSSDPDSQKFAVAELDVFGKASFGWAYWSYRNVNPQWSMKHMIKNGLISLRKN